jgi:hypothetical protein
MKKNRYAAVTGTSAELLLRRSDVTEMSNVRPQQKKSPPKAGWMGE